MVIATVPHVLVITMFTHVLGLSTAANLEPMRECMMDLGFSQSSVVSTHTLRYGTEASLKTTVKWFQGSEFVVL